MCRVCRESDDWQNNNDLTLTDAIKMPIHQSMLCNMNAEAWRVSVTSSPVCLFFDVISFLKSCQPVVSTLHSALQPVTDANQTTRNVRLHRHRRFPKHVRVLQPKYFNTLEDIKENAPTHDFYMSDMFLPIFQPPTQPPRAYVQALHVLHVCQKIYNRRSLPSHDCGIELKKNNRTFTKGKA